MGLASSTDEEFTATVGEDGVVTLGGHKDAIFFVYVISDDRIVSGSRDQTLKIWKHVQNNWICERTLKEHNGSVTCLTLFPPSYLISGSLDSTLKVWNPTSGKCLASIPCEAPVYSLCTFQDGLEFVSGLDQGEIKIWSGKAPHFHQKSCTKAHDNGVRCIKEIPGKDMFASGSYDLYVKLWNRKCECLAELKGHVDAPLCLIVLPSGLLASGGLTKDSTIKFWNIETKECVEQWKAHDDGVMSFVLLPSGLLASSSMDHSIKIWDKQNCIKKLQGHKHFVYGLGKLSDGTLISGCEDKTVKIWSKTLTE